MSEMAGIEIPGGWVDEVAHWRQDPLPGMDYCEFGCMPADHGEFEYGDPDGISKPGPV